MKFDTIVYYFLIFSSLIVFKTSCQENSVNRRGDSDNDKVSNVDEDADENLLVDSDIDEEIPDESIDDETSTVKSRKHPFENGEFSYKRVLLNVLVEKDKHVEADVYIPVKTDLNEKDEFAILYFNHGFLCNIRWYKDIFIHLASHGFVVVVPQMYAADGIPMFKIDTDKEAEYAGKIIEWMQNKLQGEINVNILTSKVGLFAHSRGNKVIWKKLMHSTEGIAGAAAIDPVDSSMDGTAGATENDFVFNFPSLFIGTELGGQKKGINPECAPKVSNFEVFYNKTQTSAYKIFFNNFGHMDMLDSEIDCGMTCGSCRKAEMSLSKDDFRRYISGFITSFFNAILKGESRHLMFLTTPPESKLEIETEVKITSCGNSKKDPGELCEENEIVECREIPESNYSEGEAICNKTCSNYDKSNCVLADPVCGNKQTEKGEECDSIKPVDCSDFGYDGGMANCENCKLVRKECYNFSQEIIDNNLDKPGYPTIGDLDGDGFKEIVLSTFGSSFNLDSKVLIYKNKGDGFSSNNWERSELFDPDIYSVCHANRSTLKDIDKDGDLDIILPSGSSQCQQIPLAPSYGISWFENRGDRWDNHEIIPLGHKIDGANECFYPSVETSDINKDGFIDLIISASFEDYNIIGDDSIFSKLYVIFGTGSETRFESEKYKIFDGGSQRVFIYDIDSDSDDDLFLAQYFGYNSSKMSFLWLEDVGDFDKSDPEKSFVAHQINDIDFGRSYEIKIAKGLINNDELVAIGTNHVNASGGTAAIDESLVVFYPQEEIRDMWSTSILSTKFTPESTFPGDKEKKAPGGFDFGDIDNDGDLDIAVSGLGDKGIYLFEQLERGIFAKRVLDDNYGESRGMQMVDIDNDGNLEIIVSSESREILTIFYLQKIK